jgi:branched-chain amino acid transport system substrate-binding protein
MRKTYAVAALVLLVLLVLPAVGQGAGAEEPLPVAVIGAKTGPASVSNAAMFQAARYAVEEINRAGGLLDRPVRMLEFDNQSTALGSRRAAQWAVQAGVLAVIGASWSAHSNAMAPVLQAAGIPMISPMSTNPEVTRHGDCIFRVCFTDPFQGSAMARFAREDLGAATAVSLVNVSRVYSEGLGSFFERAFAEQGGRVLWRGEFLLDTTDFRELLQRAAAHDPDVLYVPGDYRDSSFIIKQARELGLRATILGGDSFGLRIYDYVGQEADGCYYTTHWHRDSPLPRSREFVRRWEALFGEVRQTTIPMTYDAVTLLADAVRRAGRADRAAVRRALAATQGFPGVTGEISFNADGDPLKPLVINRLEHGGVAFVRTVMP